MTITELLENTIQAAQRHHRTKNRADVPIKQKDCRKGIKEAEFCWKKILHSFLFILKRVLTFSE